VADGWREMNGENSAVSASETDRAGDTDEVHVPPSD